jgi:hypothetical protein
VQDRVRLEHGALAEQLLRRFENGAAVDDLRSHAALRAQRPVEIFNDDRP